MGNLLPSLRLLALSILLAVLYCTSALAFESVDIEVPPPAASGEAADADNAPAGESAAVAPGTQAAAATPDAAAPAEEPAGEPPPPGPTIMFRGEVTNGALSPTFSLFSKEIIFWALYPNTDYADYEIGRTVWEKKSNKAYYSLVGYAAVWPEQDQYFVLPWFYSTIADGKTTYTINLAEYIPLNGGPYSFVADGNSVMRRITKQASVGIDSLYFKRDGLPKTAMWGPALNLASSKDRVSVYARALVFGEGEDTYRLDFYFH